MGERREKLIIAVAAVALVYGASCCAICDVPAACSAMRRIGSVPAEQLALALIPAGIFAFLLAVNAALPIGRSTLDIVHDGVKAVHRHLFVDGEDNGYWHLRIVVWLSAIIAMQIISSAVECLHGR